MQPLTLPVLLNGHLHLVASELHQVGGKPIQAQMFASLLSEQFMQGTEEDKAPAQTLFVAAFYSRGFLRGLGKACDGSAEGLL